MAILKSLQQIFDSREPVSSKCAQLHVAYQNSKYAFLRTDYTIIVWLSDIINANIDNETLSRDDLNRLWLVSSEILNDLSQNVEAELKLLHRKVVLPASVLIVILRQLKVISKDPSSNGDIWVNVYNSIRAIITGQNFDQQTTLLLKIFAKVMEIYIENVLPTEELLVQFAKLISGHSNLTGFQNIHLIDIFKVLLKPLIKVLTLNVPANLNVEFGKMIQTIFCKRDSIKELLNERQNATVTRPLLLKELLSEVKRYLGHDSCEGLSIILCYVLRGINLKCIDELRGVPFRFLSLMMDHLEILNDKREDVFKYELSMTEKILESCVMFKANYLTDDGKISRQEQVDWFRKLYEKILRLDPPSELEASWYNCLRLLATFSPEIIEPQIQSTWKLAWLNRPFWEDSVQNQGNFLRQIMEDYVTLRQIPKLFRKFALATQEEVQALKVKDLKSFPVKFSIDLAKNIQKLTANQVVELWQILLDVVNAKQSGEEVVVADQGLRCAVEILVLLMTHLKFSDGGIAIAIYGKIADLMKSTAAIANQLYQNKKPKSKIKVKLSLEMILAWCGTRLTLKLFAPDYEDHLEIKPFSDDDDLFNLDIIFPLGEVKLWENLREWMASHDRQMVILVLKLLVKKAHAVCAFGHLSTPQGEKVVRNIAKFMYLDAEASVNYVKDEDYPVELYSLQLSSLPQFASFLSAKILRDFMGKVLDYVIVEENNSGRKMTLDFLASSSFTESKRLQTATVTALLNKLNRADEGHSKRKLDQDPRENHLLKMLGDNSKLWHSIPISRQEKSNSSDSETWKIVKTVGHRLSTLYQEQQIASDFSPTMEEAFTDFLTRLKFLGAENFILTNSLRCILALVYGRSGMNVTHRSFVKIDQFLFTLIEKLDANYLTNLLDGENLLKEILRVNRVAPHGKELDFWMDKVTDRVLFLRVHNLAGLERLQTILVEVENGSDSFRDIHFLQIILRILVHKIQGRLVTLKPEYGKLCQRVAVQVAQVLREKLMTVKRFRGLEENEKLYAYQHGLRSFQSLVDVYCAKNNGMAEEESEGNLRIILKKFKNFTSLALENLEGQNDVELVQSALTVVVTVLSLKEGHEEYVPEKFALECWKKLQIQIKLQILSVNEFRICKALKLLEEKAPSIRSVALEDNLSLALKTIMKRASPEELTEIFNSLQEASYDIGKNFVASDFQTILYTWITILEIDFETMDIVPLKACFQTFFRTLLLLLHACHTSRSNLEDVVIPSLEFLSNSITRGFAHTNNVAECLQICSFLSPRKYSEIYPAKLRATLTSYIVITLNEALYKHSTQMLASSAAFQAVVSKIMSSLVELGEQNSFVVLSQRDQGLIISCLQKLEKLVSLMSNHEETFDKGVNYLIADYIHQIQRFTLFPSVKELFVPILNKLFKISDQHSLDVLRVMLDEGGREIFDIMLKDYRKYYEYKGKI